MAYNVYVKVGRGNNISTTGSIPLPNKQRVSEYIKRNPLIRSNTRIRVTNKATGITIIDTPYRFSKNPITGKYKY